MRVLVTGSREWDDPYPVEYHLRQALEIAWGRREPLVVVHGAARGADTLARLWVAGMRFRSDVDEDPHPVTPAEWRQYGKSRGHWRNRLMVSTMDPRRDLAVSFLRGDSPGTSGCIKMIKSAGIPLREVTWDNRHH